MDNKTNTNTGDPLFLFVPFLLYFLVVLLVVLLVVPLVVAFLVVDTPPVVAFLVVDTPLVVAFLVVDALLFSRTRYSSSRRRLSTTPFLDSSELSF